MYWNPVLDYVVDMKYDYLAVRPQDLNPITSYEDKGYNNALEYWAEVLREEDGYYREVLDSLLVNQYENLVLIKYNSLDVDFDIHNGFYRECRSVVIDLAEEELVLTPFRKFFNINEREETQMQIVQEKLKNAKSIEISDKMDGSMVSARWYNDKLVVAGSQALDPANSYRLEHYYEWFHENQNAVQLLKNHPNYTFIFESIWSEDVHIVQYDEDEEDLYLIGVRDVRTGNEASYRTVEECAKENGLRSVGPLTLTFEQMFKQCQESDVAASEAEGYVVSIDGQKYKCKYQNYAMMHNVIGKILSPNAILKAIREDKWDDFYSMIPQAYQPQAKEMADNVFNYIKEAQNEVKFWGDQVPGTSLKNAMLWITNNIPREIAGKVRAYYLGKDIDYLKNVKYYQIEGKAHE
jgi:hypothetical protein